MRVGSSHLVLLTLAFAVACSNSGGGTSNGAGGTSGSDGGGGPGQSGQSTGAAASTPDSGASEAGETGLPADGGAPGTPETTDAGAAGQDTTPQPIDVAHPESVVDFGAAASSLGQILSPTSEALSAYTTELTLVGSSATAVLDLTEWSTGPEAEFECSRSGGSLVVGSERILFVASDADYLAFGRRCTKIQVFQGTTYSPTLTRSFAQDALSAP